MKVSRPVLTSAFLLALAVYALTFLISRGFR